MVSYCINKLTVSGKIESLQRFLYENKGVTNLSFARTVVPPIGATTAWRVQNWGTCSDIDNEQTDIMWNFRENKFIVLFKTPWTPPISWVFYIGIKYRHLSFNLQYEDPTERFKGIYTVQSGIVTHDDYSKSCEDYDD